jgi:7-cyano-7-deazaguanine synthase
MLHKVIIFSGGMDSYTLLRKVFHETVSEGDPEATKITAISFDYGQRHSRELASAEKICRELEIPHQLIMLPIRDLLKGSALTDNIDMPTGAYDGENMRKTVVPGRNTIMLALALGIAEGKVLSEGGNALIYYGAHSGDHHIYPDCRPEYVDVMARTIYLASDGRIQLKAPFLNMNKISILQYGFSIGIPLSAYGDTWTCYTGGEKACGKCGSCDERLEAFTKNGVYDPVTYSSRGRWEEAQEAARVFAESLKK